MAPADFEFIDLCKRSDTELVEDGGAECVDDLNAVLGVLPPRRGGPLQVLSLTICSMNLAESVSAPAPIRGWMRVPPSNWKLLPVDKYSVDR